MDIGIPLEHVSKDEVDRRLHDRIEDRLAGLESDLVNVVNDVNIAEATGQRNEPQEQRAKELQEQIKSLRKQRDELKPKSS